MEKFKKLTHKYWHVLAFLGFAVIAGWYFLMQAIDPRTPWLVECPIDKMIPFCEWFILPYVLWYGYVSLPMVYLFFKSRHDFLRMAVYLFSGMAVCMLICTVFPNAIDFRPETLPRDNFLCSLTQLIYSNDRPTNVFPSMHCYESVAICVAFLKARSINPPKWVKIAMIVMAALICLSTVFIKQHSVIDGVVGVALAVPMYYFAYRAVKIREDI